MRHKFAITTSLSILLATALIPMSPAMALDLSSESDRALLSGSLNPEMTNVELNAIKYGPTTKEEALQCSIQAGPIFDERELKCSLLEVTPAAYEAALSKAKTGIFERIFGSSSAARLSS